MHTESMPLSGIFSCVRLWIFLGTKISDRLFIELRSEVDKFMKKQTIKTIVTALTAVAMVCSLTGCAGNSSGATETLNAEKSSAAENTEAAAGVEQDNEKDSVIVVMGPSSEPEAGFDPAYGWGAGEHVHEPLIQSTLTVTKADMTIGYDLATDMNVSDDGMTWTVTIRDDVKFTDGEPLTAEDVAFTYNTLRDTSSVNDFTMLKEAKALDDTTVEFDLSRPYSIWPYTMAITGIVPEHAYGPDYGSNPIGSGRYIMKQWDKGQQVILTANPDYYGDEPEMKTVTVLFMTLPMRQRSPGRWISPTLPRRTRIRP